jgi:hypothetical protein
VVAESHTQRIGSVVLPPTECVVLAWGWRWGRSRGRAAVLLTSVRRTTHGVADCTNWLAVPEGPAPLVPCHAEIVTLSYVCWATNLLLVGNGRAGRRCGPTS